MSNIIDYIKWRGDLKLEQDEFNEIDNLILSRFSYFPFDEIIQKNEIVTIKELSQRFQKKDRHNLPILWKDDPNLFILMGESKRFGEMKATQYENKINTSQEKQFSAITILMPDNTNYISYRGTDNTIVGWKEDFNMSFKSHVASQIDAVKYLETITKQYSNQLRIGGHSKGGNLAVYASIFANDQIRNRIINIYNNDGPGFNEDITKKEQYQKIIQKVNTYIPQDSVFGMLLNHEETYTVIKSSQKGLMQHDLYSWQVMNHQFIHLKEITNGSKLIDKTIKAWFEQTDAKQRGQVIDIIFEIMNTTHVETMSQMKEQWFRNAKILFKSYRMVNAEDRKMVIQTLSALFKIVTDNVKQEIKK